MEISPAQLAGATTPGGGTVVSAEAQDLINRVRDHYRSIGKGSAAHNYGRHMKSFFSWAEKVGHNIKTLPADSLESFLATMKAAGQKETTLYVTRTQLKSALKACTDLFGVDFSHIEYETGRPRASYVAQKNWEKKKRAEKMLAKSAQTLQALNAARNTIFGTSTAPVATETAEITTMEEGMEDDGMSDQSVTTAGGGNNGQQPVVVLQVPANTGNGRPVATLGAPNNRNGQQNAAQPDRGILINNYRFNGPFIRVSRMADGSDPLTPPGTEVFVQTLPAATIAPHGDVASFLQSYLIPKMRLPAVVSQVHFIFHELNDKRQPTGKRDELVVSVSGGEGVGMAQAPAPVSQIALGGVPYSMPSAPDSATSYLIQKLDRDAEEAKKRAESLQDEMKKASDAQTTFLLMQQFQKEQDLRRQIEEDRRRAERALDVPPPPPPSMNLGAMPFPSILPPEPARDNSAAEFAKALAESQKNMMELMLASMNRPVPPPPPPPVQKDAAEWLVPFMAQMNQQSQQQQQANQQMIVQIMQANQQFMQALLTRENPMEKLLFTQLQEVKAAANAPKADELEGFADKLQKMKMVSDMLGGGGGGGGILADLLANADVIGAGAAKVIAAAKTGGPTPTPAQLAARPNAPAAPSVPQLTAGQPAAAPVIPAPPEEALNHLKSVVAGVDSGDDQAVINGMVAIVQTFMAAPEPYPSTGRKILAAFKNADDEGELYTLAKNLWTVLGQQYDRPAAKAIAKVLAKWYSIVHQQIFGEPRELMGDVVDSEEGEEVDEEGIDDAEGSDEGTALVAGG